MMSHKVRQGKMIIKSNQPDRDNKTDINREARHRHPQGNSPTYSGIPSSTPWTRQTLRNVRTPSTIMWGEMGTNDGGLNINIQPAQKPRKLQELTYSSIRAFQAEFRLYHLESKGQATLYGHISEKMVTVIDSLLGTNNRYAHLLGHGRECVPDLPEFFRREYPWLHTPQREHWEDLLEALKELRPEGGSFTLRSFEHLMAMGEECNLHFAFETKASGEDTYMDKLLDNERKVDWKFLSDKQKGAYFKLLIRGVGSRGSSGFNVSRRSRTYEEDCKRIEIMKNQAMLEVHTFASSRRFTDWVIQYLHEMRAKIAQASIYEGWIQGERRRESRGDHFRRRDEYAREDKQSNNNSRHANSNGDMHRRRDKGNRHEFTAEI